MQAAAGVAEQLADVRSIEISVIRSSRSRGHVAAEFSANVPSPPHAKQLTKYWQQLTLPLRSPGRGSRHQTRHSLFKELNDVAAAATANE
jgi:hypothetical protein